eukprot:CAMPEP_0115017700 /NCGR_PEP_ID=MMETSP0216-20121206/28293_1 /TAXON_ID=223996 /ORGANISM="Protocruzia adherens, Strain Boccale" /LENGTH=432 /DNA_ID=CAMNT_0002388607 /DNA_START=30 /DNA_END=1328 /DNA_ORIENTATION=+
MPKFGNKQSKRQTLHKKHKVEKKVREHTRKLKKEARKQRAMGVIPKLKKDPGIPNIYPFKKDLLDAMERKQQFELKEKARLLQEKKDRRKARKGNLSELVSDAQTRGADYEEEKVDETGESQVQQKGDQSRKQYIKELKKVVEAADVVVIVLDARDPMAYRNKDMEAEILGMGTGNKKIILLLNKIDLVPAEVAQAWQKELKKEFATILFKSNTQSQSGNLSQNALYGKSITTRKELTEELLSSNKAVGADDLLELLKNYSRHGDVKTAITVGIIGFPNVGKSSVINSLKRNKAVGVSSTAGFTKIMQEITLDKKIKLLDCPGIVFTDAKSSDLNVLKNVVKIEDLDDPYRPVDILLQKVNKMEILKRYEIAEFDENNPTQFLAMIANKRGKLKKGGIPDFDQAARLVLQDWTSGRLPYYTVPPTHEDIDMN